MKSIPCVVGGVIVCAGIAPVAFGDITPVSRLSSLRATAFCGNGPASVSYDETVDENGVLTSGQLHHNHTTLFDDETWGSSDAVATMTQDIQFTDNLPTGLRIDGDLSPNLSETHLYEGSYLGAPALAQGTTDSSFTYIFDVTAPTAWSIVMDATRNPTADFAVSMYRLDAPGYIYFSPLGLPFTDSDNGVLDPGQYKLFVRQNTFAFGAVTPSDSSIVEFSLTLGEVPSPGTMGLVGVGVLVGARRRR